MRRKLWEWGDQKCQPSVCTISAQSGTSSQIVHIHHRRIMLATEIRANSRHNLPRNNCCTNANYILEGSCGNGEAKYANPPFVQSAHKSVRARKLFIFIIAV